MWWWNVLIGVLLVGRDVHGLKGHLRRRLSGFASPRQGLQDGQKCTKMVHLSVVQSSM